MSRLIRASQRRGLAFGLLILCVLSLAWCLHYAVLKANAHYDLAIATRLENISRYDRVASTRPYYEMAIAEVHASNPGKFYIKTQPPALAASEIQQTVQPIFEANALRVESIVIAAHKDQDFHRRITLNVRVRGKLGSVQQAFHAIEAGRPYLYIDNVTMLGTVRSNFVPIPSVEPEITAQFDVYGYSLLKNNENITRH